MGQRHPAAAKPEAAAGLGSDLYFARCWFALRTQSIWVCKWCERNAEKLGIGRDELVKKSRHRHSARSGRG